MVIVIDVLHPDLDTPATALPEPLPVVEKPREDYSRITRVQVINIKGEIIDVQQ